MLQNNTLNKVIAIVSAIVIWAYVISAVNPPTSKTIRDVPIQFINTETLAARGLAVSNDDVVNVDVVIEGKRSVISQITADNIEATADLTGFPKGLNTVRVDVDVYEDGVRAEARPETVQILIEDLVSVNKPVDLVYNGDFEKGTEAGSVRLSPEQIEVSGPKSKVDSVTSIQVALDVNKLDDSEQTYTLEAIPLNTRQEKVSGLKLSQDTVEVTAHLAYTKSVALEVNVTGEVSENHQVENIDIPSTVIIKGPKERIDAVESVRAADVDISGIDVTTTIPLNVDLPTEIELAKKSENVAIEVILKGISNKTFEYQGSSIEINGLAAGYTAHVNTGTVSVTIYGKDNVIVDFKKSDMKLYVNLEDIDLDKESISVPVQLRYSKELSKTEATPVNVQIILKKEE